MTRQPGDLLLTLADLDRYRTHRWRVADLPPRNAEALRDAVAALQHYLERDPQAAIPVEYALRRVRLAIEDGFLGAIPKHDIKTLAAFCREIPTTVRRPAA